MSKNYGKAFEQKFKEDFIKSFPDGTIDRLVDAMTGFKTITNVSDFIGYNYPSIFYLECKVHKGNTFPISNLTQYEQLTKKCGIKGVRAGVILWFIDHDNSILYIPIKTFIKLKAEGKKSFNINMVGSNEYDHILIPSVKKRTFYDSDYSVLKYLEEGW